MQMLKPKLYHYNVNCICYHTTYRYTKINFIQAVAAYFFLSFIVIMPKQNLNNLIYNLDNFYAQKQTIELRFSDQVRGSSYPRVPQSWVRNRKLPIEYRGH